MKGLERLAALYGRVERMEAVSAQMAAAAAARVARERVLEKARGSEEQGLAKAALVGGDRGAWVLAESAGGFSAERLGRLTQVQVQRDGARDMAMERYVASRLKTEQVVQVVERRQRQVKVVEERRAQALADDRHGARLGWLRAQERMKER